MSVPNRDDRDRIDLAVAGNLLVDDVVFRDGRTRMGEAGGATLYTSLGASLWGARVGAVSFAGVDYPHAALDALAARGVDLGGIAPLDGPGIRAWLLYEETGRRIVHQLGRPSHEAATPRWEHFPEAARRARAIHIAPMPLACQRGLAQAAARAGALVSIDPHVAIAADTLADWRMVLTHADLLFASDEELRLVDAGDARVLARALGGGRLRWVAVKRGAAGGVLHDLAAGVSHPWSARAERVEDPTGAGDAFAAGFLTSWLEDEEVAPALARGVVTASFAIAAWGADGLWRATRADAAARLRAWFGLGLPQETP